jgi:eukaryotic-like serine/threonine-protein kinase
MNETKEFSASGGPVPPLLAGRYRLGAILGRGGMAEVLRADDTLLGRPVAIKLFRPEVASAADQRGHSAEIRALAGLRHPGLVTLLDAGTDAPDTPAERPFLVMELIDGPSLSDRLATGPLAPDLVADLGAQLAETLAYVHANGIVHRDVKPANILLDEVPGRAGALAPKLTDFGVARLIDATRLTQVGMTVGTANYLSPEQALGYDVDGATDVYGLGLVLLQCLTGRLAFPGTGVATAAARLHRDPDVPAGLDERWRRLLTAMTRREPAERPTAAQVADVLHETARVPAATRMLAAAPAVSLRIDRARTTVVPSPTRSRHWLVWAVLAALAVVLIAVATLLVNYSSGPGGGSTPGPTAPPTSTSGTTSSAATTPSSTPVPTDTAPVKPPGKDKPTDKGKGKGKSG